MTMSWLFGKCSCFPKETGTQEPFLWALLGSCHLHYFLVSNLALRMVHVSVLFTDVLKILNHLNQFGCIEADIF